MLPRPFLRKWGIAARTPRKMLFKFKFTTKFHSSSVNSWIFLRTPPPALLKRMSSPPKCSRAAATIRSQSVWTVTSMREKSACPPSCSIRLSTLGFTVSWISQHTTFAPSRAKRRAVARPMPLLAPVTIATLPGNLPSPFPSPGCSFIRMFLPLVELFDKPLFLKLLDKAHIDKTLGICGRGLGIAWRKVVEHSLDSFWSRIRGFREDHAVGAIGPLQTLGIGD